MSISTRTSNHPAALAAVLGSTLVATATAGVFNDAHFLFYGGTDTNANGYIDAGDIEDYRHYGANSAASQFYIYNGNNFTTAEKQQAFSVMPGIATVSSPGRIRKPAKHRNAGDAQWAGYRWL